MRRLVLLVALASSAMAARAAQRVTVEQLQRVLAQQQAAHVSDEQAAQQLGSLELTERLTEVTLERIQAEFHPGEKTTAELNVLADLSAFLDPPARELPDKEPPTPAAQQKILSAAMDFVNVTLRHLPNFLATRSTRSFEDVPVFTADSSFQSGLHPMGLFVREVAYRNGLEYASKAPAAGDTGPPPAAFMRELTSAGEFGPVLATIMTDSGAGRIAWSHWEQTPSGLAAVFRYEVPKEAAHYEIDFCCVRDPETDTEEPYYGRPGYHGTISVDPATGAILRLTLQADFDDLDQPPSFGLLVQYGRVEIGGAGLVCPLRSAVLLRDVTVARDRKWNVLYLNEVSFSNYRRFGSTARIVPDTPKQ